MTTNKNNNKNNTQVNLKYDPNQHLHALRTKQLKAGGDQRVASQHKRGKLTARERIERLFDAGTFVELFSLVEHNCRDFGLESRKYLGDGVISGFGLVNGRQVYAYSQDFTILGGSLSETNAKKIVRILELAVQNGVPVVALSDSGGARIHEGVGSLGGYADIFYRNVQASGVVPQLSVIMGPCAGGAVYSPALNDFIFMVDQTSHMFITGPDVVKAVTAEEVSFEELGGSETHSAISGVADRRYSSDSAALQGVRTWLSYIPSHNLAAPPLQPDPDASDDPVVQEQLADARDKLATIVPQHPHHPYDMQTVVESVMDPQTFWVIKPEFAPNLLVGLARLAGQVVGVVANNPYYLAGVLDINASAKGARFVRFCDAFQIPLITFVDVPGFLPGKDQEKGGIIRHGAKLLYAYAEATVPKLTVIIRKAYGGAYDVMSSKHLGGDLNLAWPGAEIAVMGAEAACNIIFKGEINAAEDPQHHRAQVVAKYAQSFANPYQAARKGFLDEVIFPGETRQYFSRALAMSRGKRVHYPRRKHGNIPL